MRLAEFTLSRKDPGYVERAKQVQQFYRNSKNRLPNELNKILELISDKINGAGDVATLHRNTGIGSLVSSVKPGDGSAREQAASCQKVLGTWANIAREYATKRYRSNCINWGILPLISDAEIPELSLDSYVFLPAIRNLVENGSEMIGGWLINGDTVSPLSLSMPDLTDKDREVLLAGNLINYHAGIQ
jgi:aconitate hydratase